MKRWTPTQDEMKKRTARFNELVSTKKRILDEIGIPPDVMEMITAKVTRNIMSPGPLPGQLSPKPAVEGGDAGVFRLGIVTCPQGQGPGLHVHYHTHETFMALTGKWEIQWGDHGEEATVLEPFDLVAVPPAVTRRFVNLSDRDAHLLVIIQGQPEEFDDVDRVPETAKAIAARHGEAMVEKLKQHGWKFNIGVEDVEH
ncbi:MAG TPA: cupin domain-containing protein [Burkholderiaceae bacterium]|nr:cupin domain-containing protein [Burkholderiaceae bacterium]